MMAEDKGQAVDEQDTSTLTSCLDWCYGAMKPTR